MRVATEDFQIRIENVAPGNVSAFGEPSRAINKSSASIEGRAIVRQQVQLTFSPSSPCVLAGHVFAGGAATIAAKERKLTAGGLPVMVEGDSGQCAGAFTQGQTTVPCACRIEISDAGQRRVECR